MRRCETYRQRPKLSKQQKRETKTARYAGRPLNRGGRLAREQKGTEIRDAKNENIVECFNHAW